MLIQDRVICDVCGTDMGKLMQLPAPQSDLIPDLNLPPHFAVCPDCEPLESESEPEQRINSGKLFKN